MKSARPNCLALRAGLVREAAGTLLPAALAVTLFLVVPADSRSQAESAQNRGKPEDAALCETWHRGSGETVPLDLARVKAAYRDLKSRVTRAVDAQSAPPAVDLRKPYDAGLPACGGDDTRSASMPPEKGARVKGRTFYFAAVGDPAKFALPPDVERDPAVQVLILKTRSLGDLPEIAKRFGRPISLGSADFAKVMGVRCANSWVKFSEKGDEIQIRESR
ncbi:MAG TPA: hypothetical protein VKU80_08660 [Planctomycetota bacterium]|nr:hypothetical protein [Planctomycetota bacterium]